MIQIEDEFYSSDIDCLQRVYNKHREQTEARKRSQTEYEFWRDNRHEAKRRRRLTALGQLLIFAAGCLATGWVVIAFAVATAVVR